MRLFRRTAIFLLIISGIVIFCNLFLVDWYVVPSNSMTPTLKVGSLLMVQRGIMRNIMAGTTSISVKKNDIFVFKMPNWVDNEQEKKQFFVKRCVGLPGDTVRIRYNRISPKATPMLGQVKHMYLFPQDTLFSDWSSDNYGPIWIPKKGDSIILSPYNVRLYRKILLYESPDIVIDNESVWNNGKRLSKYHFLHNYYFMLGDNFHQAEDSRNWGCVPDELLIGRVIWHS